MKASRIVLLVAAIALFVPPSQSAAQTETVRNNSIVIWKNPGNIASRNLYYGPGSRSLAPAPPFRFVEEDTSGTNPKFKVKDSRNVEWSVKLGRESQSETVATRLVWAVGYFAEEAYYFPQVHIDAFKNLSRGHEFFDKAGNVRAARFEPRRSNVKRGEEWSWRENPFTGSRELDGLRVMMLLLNNWDVKTQNNRVLITSLPGQRRTELRYVVTDLGATLGRAGALGEKRSKNNAQDYYTSRFVRGVDDGMVDFDYDVTPTGLGVLSIAYPPAFLKQQKKDNAMHDIPVAHAHWIGLYLAQLTNTQLHDALRAASYDSWSADLYVSSLRQRINQLTQLQPSRYARSDVSLR